MFSDVLTPVWESTTATILSPLAESNLFPGESSSALMTGLSPTASANLMTGFHPEPIALTGSDFPLNQSLNPKTTSVGNPRPTSNSLSQGAIAPESLGVLTAPALVYDALLQGGNDSLNTARDIGSLKGTQTFSNRIGDRDQHDYRFSLNTSSQIRLNLSGLAMDANLQLLDTQGNVIQLSAANGTRSEDIYAQLVAGSYLARVSPFAGTTAYTLNVTANPTTIADRAGNRLETARDLGTLTTTQTLTDWVGPADTQDCFRFHLNTAGRLALNLTQLTADADVQLLDSQGQVLEWAAQRGKQAENISRLLAAGTYFVQVSPLGARTSYKLKLTAHEIEPSVTQTNPTISPELSIEPGRSLEAAQPWQSPIASKVDRVTATNGSDLYQFTIDQSGIFTANLSNLSGDADVRLIQDANHSGRIDPHEILAWQWERGTVSESIRHFLTPGEYYLEVFSYRDQSADYQLTTDFALAISDPYAFKINLNFVPGSESLSTGMISAVEAAANFWETVISHSTLSGAHILDIDVGGSIQTWDNDTKVLASAGATQGIQDTAGYWLPMAGVASINTHPQAISSLTDNLSYFQDLMIHEFGHVLGLIGLTNDFVDMSTGTYRAHTYAGWAYGELLGTYQQTAIPMTIGVGTGSDGVHWQEQAFDHEVMTPIIGGQRMGLPVSQMTIAALHDLGWQVNYGAAQGYQLPS